MIAFCHRASNKILSICDACILRGSLFRFLQGILHTVQFSCGPQPIADKAICDSL